MSIDAAEHGMLAAGVLPKARLLMDGRWSDGAAGESAPLGNPSAAQVQAEIV